MSSSQDTAAANKFGQSGLLSQLCLLSDFRNKRASSWDRTGGNDDFWHFAPGQTRVLMEESGAGCVKHFYWTYIHGDERNRQDIFRNMILRAYWDGSDKPSIEVPLGDLFGVSNGIVRPIQSLAFTTNPGFVMPQQGSFGFNCYLPMPFAKGARIELENQSAESTTTIWYHIDYELYDAPSALPENAGRLHALWNRLNPTVAIPPQGRDLAGEGNYDILSVEADGKFAGYFMSIVNFNYNWYGEGDDMIFIDGESYPPSILGTGTEEIFGGGACPATEYTGPYTGFHCIENRGADPRVVTHGFHNPTNYAGTNGMYRFYLNDPLRFRKSIRVTIEHGHANDMANDYSSVAFWYQDGVNANLPALPGRERRTVSMPYLTFRQV